MNSKQTLQLARQGNPDAIATILNRALVTRGVKASVCLDRDRLKVQLASDPPPKRDALVPPLEKAFQSLSPPNVSGVTFYGLQEGSMNPIWSSMVDFDSPEAQAVLEQAIQQASDRAVPPAVTPNATSPDISTPAATESSFKDAGSSSVPGQPVALVGEEKLDEPEALEEAKLSELTANQTVLDDPKNAEPLIDQGSASLDTAVNYQLTAENSEDVLAPDLSTPESISAEALAQDDFSDLEMTSPQIADQEVVKPETGEPNIVALVPIDSVPVRPQVVISPDLEEADAEADVVNFPPETTTHDSEPANPAGGTPDAEIVTSIPASSPYIPQSITTLTELLEHYQRGNRNFVNAQLSSTDLAEAYLPEAVFTGSDLSYSSLSGATLESADFTAATLVEVNLSESNLRGANLCRSNLEGAVLERANARQANFSESLLSATDWRGANLSEADFSNATLDGAWMQQTNLRGADLRGAHLDNVLLQGACFSPATQFDREFSPEAAGMIRLDDQPSLPLSSQTPLNG